MSLGFILFAILMQIDLLIAEAECKTIFPENFELKLQNFRVKTFGCFEIETSHHDMINVIYEHNGPSVNLKIDNNE